MKNPLICLYVFLLLLLPGGYIISQPRIVWDTTFGGTGIEYGHDFARIPGGFIAVSKCGSNDFNVLAATDPDGSGNHAIFGIVPTEDFWVKKLNDNGQIIWQNSLGGTGSEEATCVAPTSDGGYIIGGFIGGVFGSLSATGDLAIPDADGSGLRGGGSDMWIVKLDANGLMQWHNIIGGSNFDFAHDVIQTSDGGYLVVGDTYSNDLDASAANDVDGSGRHGAGANPDIWVLKLRANGTIQWSNLLGGSTFDYGGSCIEVNGGYLISGTSSSADGDLALPDVDGTPAHGSYDYWVVKLNLNGNVVWDNAIGGSSLDLLYSSPGIIATTDGNFVLTGRSHSTNGDAATALDVDGLTQRGNADYWVVKINPNGGIIWRNHMGTSDWDEIESAYIACDGGIIVSGYSQMVAANGDKTMANPNGARCPWLVKLNNNGMIEWDYAFASAGPNFDGPHHGFSYGMTKDYYVLIDSLGGDYFVLTTSQNPPGNDKTAPLKGQYDSWFVKFTFELDADFTSDTACFGTPTQFTDLSTFTNVRPIPKYTWDFGDASSGAANTSTLKNPTHVFTAPGTFTVTQIVQYECKYDTMIHTAYVPPPPTINFSDTYVCNGSNVTINPVVNPTGGTYAWAPGGQITPSINVSPISNTTYSLTYTEPVYGCTVSAATTVTVNPVPTLTISSYSDVLCNGGNTGSATVSVVAGTAPYTYAWMPTAQTSATATSLSIGTYTATVTDGNGCSSAITATISEPALLQAFIPSQNNVICNGASTGSATATQLGGVGPYTYAWNPSAQTNAIVSNIAAGTYSVTITDNNGCTAQSSVTITQAPAITATVNVASTPLCFGDANGMLSVALNNGTAPYTYAWNPSAQTGSLATGLAAGTYSVSIVDLNGCTASASGVLNQPAVLTMTLNSTPDHCALADGTANVTGAGGGTPGYSYTWSTGGSTALITNLSAGTYTATLTDVNGCTLSQSVIVNSQASDTLQLVSLTNAGCNGSCDGSAVLQLSGAANGPYTYNWSTVPSQTTLTATGLCAGVYTCTVVDGVGCSSTMQVNITEPPVLTASITAQTNVLCNGELTGSATVSGAGGTLPYTYNWTGGQTSSNATGLGAGSYTATITDNNGCTSQTTLLITEPAAISSTLSATDLTCNGNNTGEISTNISGGLTPYTYNWSNGSTTSTISNLAAGNYSLTITDNNGCVLQVSTIVNEPPVLTMNLNSTPDYCSQSNGTATINPAGGTAPYTYTWSNSQATAAISNLSSGVYTATVTDNNGCVVNGTITVNPQSADTLQLTSIINNTCNGSCDGEATLQLSGLTNAPYTYNWSTIPAQNMLTATGLCAGVYTCTVSDVNGCTDTMSVVITQPAVISATLVSTNTRCFGDNTGTISTNVSGGTPAYTYLWNNTQASPVATGLAAGNYTVTITDNNGCSADFTAQVNDAPQLLANIPVPADVCEGNAATINTNVIGGTPIYNYLWNTGQNTANITTNTLLVNTSFTVTVTDNNGCTALASTNVIVNALPLVSFTSDKVQGCAVLCVNFTNTTPNTQSQTWSFGDNGTSSALNPNHCYSNTGAYNVKLTVTDNNGCSNSLTQNNYITVHPDPVASFTATPQPATILNPTILFSSDTVGVTSWLWSFGDVAASSSSLANTYYTYVDTGNYSVQLVVVNEYNCSDTVYKIVRINPDYVLYMPNTFTPNGDGQNEVFIPVGIGVDIDKYEFYVYDRWGNLIFKTNNPAIGWDGRANGGAEIAQQDTYVWKLITKDVLGKTHRYSGHVNLIR